MAGMRGAEAVLRPADLPGDRIDVRWVAVPPGIPAEFFIEATARPAGPTPLPDSFVLAACESPATLPLLLAAWTWVESSLGDLYGLVLAASDEEGRAASERAAEQRGLAESVRSVVLGDEAWPAAIHGAAVLLHGGTRTNAAALRWALAGGLPVAAPATPISESIVGPAGYLVSPPEARALGAACLTLLVEEEMAASLRAKGKVRAGSYRVEAAATAWARSLRQAATSRGR
jgi:glycosyltransferase involved in cell wall biosynthesis